MHFSGARCAKALISAVLFLLGMRDSAQALVNLREGSIGFGAIRSDTSPDSGTTIGFNFYADLTASDRDPSKGITFIIAEKDPVTDHPLFHLILEPCGPIPPIGGEVIVRGALTLSCDSSGNLRTRAVYWSMYWCDTSGAQECGGKGVGRGTRFAFSPAEPAFELVIQDENGKDTPIATPENAVACNQNGSGALTVLRDFNSSGFASSWLDPTRVQSSPHGYLGVFFDPAGMTCSTTATPFVPFSFYILARLTGVTKCGLSGVEFRLTGLPPGWFPNVVGLLGPNVVNSPLQDGTDYFFDGCRAGNAEVLDIFRVDVLPTTPATDVVLTIQKRDPPTNVFLQFPYLLLCDSDYIVSGAQWPSAVINPSPGNACTTTVSVQSSNWSHVKSLYR